MKENWIMGTLALFVVFAFFGGYYIGASDMKVSFEMDNLTANSVSEFAKTIEELNIDQSYYSELELNLSKCEFTLDMVYSDFNTLTSRMYQDIVYFEDESYIISGSFTFEGNNILDHTWILHKVIEES